MSLAQTIQTAWNNQEKWLIVLRPLSWLYRFAFLMNKAMYTHKLKQEEVLCNGDKKKEVTKNRKK